MTGPIATPLRRSNLTTPSAGITIATLIAAACSGPSEPVGSGTTGATLRIVTGLTPDTVFTYVQAPIEVEIRQANGSPFPRVPVAFRPLVATDSPLSQSVYIEDSRRPGEFSTGTQGDTTDANGRASIRARLGRYAGPGGVIVTAATLGLSDTVRVNILRGKVVRLTVVPKDTAVYVGQSYQIRALALDAYDNAGDTTATFDGALGSVSVNSTGRVTGLSIGRGAVAYRLPDASDSARVSVVPVGTLAVHLSREFAGDSLGVGVVNLDGSGFRRVVIETQPRSYGGEEPAEHEMAPRWSPDATAIVYQESRAVSSANTTGVGEWRVFSSDLAGNRRRLFDALELLSDAQPTVSPDGSTLYFAGRAAGVGDRIWKSQITGANASRLMREVGEEETRPAVSPDGRQLAYAVGAPGSLRLELAVHDFTTGVTRRLGIEGTSPRWSPQGDLIAYVRSGDRSGFSGPLRVVRPDGSGDRSIAGARSYAPVVDWSPDGRYLVAARTSFGGLELIDVGTGVALPLPYAGRMSQPAWKPR